ncbi:RNA methyltransferase [Pseudoteredinibacter isoporae]|uniref:tRNA G18 (Ribose-2'-O)-methylase SpoU n=1 Tax=Pseudoteredinibacter isoporae TaxID=570281 RepID=A0A7X0JUZ9_9GAMM|nr:RNA methyltransferase [Pseudoteredinibacter isoporae]MBB6522770.1 tRNA G18 (ribose-2'-O)-methylase SpoU [Pseudoteredinibacter isoporae]NHO88298.1 RNA methyltransferase [Pseudoteredinibacter isoporae]NIB23371.1 RNA methyltransferase [Pseudoteredinibacter isoporae]
MTSSDRQLEHHEHRAESTLGPGLSFLLHNIESPSNVGALFRCADALGCEHIYLSGSTAAPPNRKLRKASRSAELYVSYSKHNHFEDLLDTLKENRVLTLALELSVNSIALENFVLDKKYQSICLVPGSENHGLDEKLLNACEQAVYIPMRGHNSSMNIATACAIAAYRLQQG